MCEEDVDTSTSSYKSAYISSLRFSDYEDSHLAIADSNGIVSFYDANRGDATAIS